MRSDNSIKNFLVGIFGQIITLLLGFVSRSLFLMILSVDYLGASGLFSSILTMLSFAELGIGTAIIYSLYKPLADNNTSEILALMNLFKKVYRIIGVVVLVAGTACLPFLDFFVKDRKGIEHLELIYMLFVVHTAISYFFSYNRSLITADQKAYRLVKIDFAYKFIYIIIPIGVLALTHSYIAYLISQIVLVFLYNLVVYCKVRKDYPILQSHEKPKLSDTVKHAIIKNTVALLMYKVAIVVTAGTDNLLITYFFGLTAVGICSNYTLVIQNMTGLVSNGITAVTASIGNLSSTENDDKKYSIFKVIFLINFWIYGFAAIGMYFCLDPLVEACFGDQYVMDMSTTIPMILGFLILGMQGATSVFRDAQGLFWHGKLRPLLQTLVNLGASILLAVFMKDVSAIFWGTVISRITTTCWYDPYVVFKYGFNKPLWGYFKQYGYCICVLAVAFVLCMLSVGFVSIPNIWLNLLVKAALCTVIINAIFFAAFFKTDEFNYLLTIFKNIIKKFKRV